jgi:hypothetical protein
MIDQEHIPTTDDGYGEVSQEQRPGEFVKFLDSVWLKSDLPIEASYRPIAIAVGHALTHWKDGRVVEEIDTKPLPDLDELNSTIPEDEKELGLDGGIRQPWSHTYKVFLLDTTTGERAIFATSSTGGKIAWDRLTDAVRWMRRFHRKSSVVPRVELATAPMKTRYSPMPRKRPDFRIVEWLDIGSGAPLPLTSDTPQLAK